MTIQFIKHKQDKRAHIPSREEAGTKAANPKVKAGKKTALLLPKRGVPFKGDYKDIVMVYMAVKDLKKTREFREKLDAEGELILTKDGQPFAMMIGIDADNVEESLCEVRRALFSSAVLRGRRKATENPPTPEELEAEIAAARA